MSLHNYLEYNPTTGAFTWKAREKRQRHQVGDVVLMRKGKPRQIFVGGKYYLAHHLAWYFVHGVFPADQIDHIDRDPSNNAIWNLREASNALNSQNKIAYSNSSSGIKGVTFVADTKRSKPWLAFINIQGKRISMAFETKEEAVKHRASLEAQYHPFTVTTCQ